MEYTLHVQNKVVFLINAGRKDQNWEIGKILPLYRMSEKNTERFLYRLS